MFHKGDYIIYGIRGVFQVKAVGIPEITAPQVNKPYYTLIPLADTNETIYTPVDSKVFMRTVISPNEAQQFMEEITIVKGEVLNNNDAKWLTGKYENTFYQYKCEDLLKLIKTILIKNRQTILNGKRLNQLDTKYLRQAQDLLFSEISFSLKMLADEVKRIIEETVMEEIKCESYS